MPYFIFCVHNHQPVGNFGHVIEESYNNAYLPFLKSIYKYPSIKLSFHITGYLLDWLLKNHKEYVEMLHAMVKKGQVEMMGGGYYEPILAVIPPADRIGQIEMMSDKLEETFGKRPRGMWLAERIWEPQLPRYLKEAGMEYVVVDDYHFVKAGLRKEQLSGYYITEDLGSALKVFPGSERLRYIIPFETVDKFMENIKWVSALGSGHAAIFADDGEKFGTWPGTHQWVYKEGWLNNFLETISENKELIRSATFSEYMDGNEPLGRVYLPTTSYMEMGEWALPAEASETYTNLISDIKTWQDGEMIRRFLQGGFWRNFFSKYSEANWMHKRMLFVSEQCSTAGGQKKTNHSSLATHNLYMAQCNDAYWHGIFGGLYLPHLRSAIYENLIKAENLLEESSQRTGESQQGNVSLSTEKDFDADTFDEIFIRTRKLNIFISPHDGGSITEMDYRPKAVNLSNTLSRWEEGYHKRVKAKSRGGESGEAKSIHDLTMAKEEGLEEYLFFDKHRRVSLIDHFLNRDETLDAFRRSEYEELGDFAHRLYEKRVVGSESHRGKEGSQIVLNRTGTVKGQSLLLEKKISVKGDEIGVTYLVKESVPNPKLISASGGPDSKLLVRFGVEFNLILPCCDGMDGFYEMYSPGAPFEKGEAGEVGGLGSSGEAAGIGRISIIDKWTRMKVDFSFDKETSLWRFPIETVSISEAGFERVFQGSCILFFWDMAIDRVFETSFRVKVESI